MVDFYPLVWYETCIMDKGTEKGGCTDRRGNGSIVGDALVVLEAVRRALELV